MENDDVILINQENTFEIIGEFGKFQKLILLFAFFEAFCSTEMIWVNFTAYTPQHFCKIDALSNLSVDLQKYIAIPQDDERKYSSCEVFDLNYTDMDMTQDFSHWNRSKVISENVSSIDCDSWIYQFDHVGKTVSSDYDFVCSRKSMYDVISSISMAGALSGNIVSGILSDKFGRKKAWVFYLVLKLIASITSTIYSSHPYFYLVGRFISGFSLSHYAITLVLVSEFMGNSYRNIVGLGMGICWSLKAMILPGIAYICPNWEVFHVVNTIPMLFMFAYLYVLPESPRWLLVNGRTNEYIQTMTYIAKFNGKTIQNLQLEEIIDDGKTEQTNHGKVKKQMSVIDLFRTMNMRLRSCVVMFAWFTCSLIYYAISFNAAGLVGDIFLNAFLINFVDIPSGFLCMWMVGSKWFGRKISHIIFFGIAGVASFAIILVSSCNGPIILITMLCLVGKMGANSAFNGFYLYTVELYPTELRMTGLMLGNMFARTAGIAAPFFGKTLQDIWQPLTNIVFGFFGIFTAFLIVFMPETLNKDLPETVEDVEK